MILAEIRCVVCGRLLDRVFGAPVRDEDWSTCTFVHICQRHGEGAGHGNIRAWVERRRRAGKLTDRVQTGRWVPWTELRPAVEKARRTGKTQVHSI